MELDSVTKWVSWVLSGFGVDVPGLVKTVVAVPVDDMSVVSVGCSMNIKTFLWQVSDVLSGTLVEESLLVVTALPWSHDSSNSDSPSLTVLVGKSKSSV